MLEAMPWIWIGIMILCLVIEALSYNLVSIWFSVGSIVPLILSIFEVNVYVQISVFLVISIILILSTRNIAQKYIKKNEIKTNSDSYIGEICYAKESFKKDEIGEVSFNNMSWRAKGKEDIEAGDKCEILAINGVKLIIKKIEKEND